MTKTSEYKPRIADQLLRDQLEATGVVLIQGPKWCGKTTTAEQAAKSVVYMDDPVKRGQYKILSETSPMSLLQGQAPHLVDEWQIAPNLWDVARFDVSHRRLVGQYIFTGSAVPPDKSKIQHTGTGRFAWLTMRPMSLWESNDSNGSISLAKLFKGEATSGIPAIEKSLEEISFLICRGGWPGALQLTAQASLLQARNYLDAIAHQDISRVDGVNRDTELTYRLLRSYARHQGQQAPITTLSADLKGNDDTSVSNETIATYISALKEIFVIEDMPAWNPNLRSKTAIRTSDNRYFVDPSIAAAALGVGPNDLMNDLNTLGLLFETMCIRDLRIYADALDGKLYHYRDKNGLECDAVMHLRNGSYGLIEIKLGGEKLIEEGTVTLNKLANKIDTTKMKQPSFRMVLTGVGAFAYQRKDGTWVVPISCLKP